MAGQRVREKRRRGTLGVVHVVTTVDTTLPDT